MLPLCSRSPRPPRPWCSSSCAAHGARLLREALLVGAVVAAPLALFFFPYDVERTWSLLVFNAFAALWLLGEVRTPSDVPLRPGSGVALLLLAAASAFLCIPLMDDEVERFGASLVLALYAPLLGTAAVLLLRAGRRGVEAAA
jgi:hypothetical protein